MKVAVFVGTRADLGPLEPVLVDLARRDEVDLTVLCGVAWSADALREYLAASLGEGGRWEVHELCPPLGTATEASLLAHGEELARGMRAFLEAREIDALVVLGDRWELLYVVPPAFLAKVPIVHLHGGEVTEGALDERVRHAVTKLADLHCVASEDAAARVRQLGEEDSRIRVTGAPGLDRLVGIQALEDSELAGLLGQPAHRPLALFTYHPVTASAGDLGEQAREALLATLTHCGAVIVTAPGMDAGRDQILAAMAEVAASDDRVIEVPNLGHRFPRVLASVDVVVGNSSSGVIEAASAGVPAVDIGDRQRGRLRGENVISAPEGEDAVSAAVERALSPEFRATARSTTNPYGDGSAARSIGDAILETASLRRAKMFVDNGGKE